MDSMTLELLAYPFAACVILTGIHCYLGLHVISRGVIFVDLALAQIAALGAALTLLLPETMQGDGTAYGLSLACTVVGAAIFSFCRVRDDAVPHEAIIGIVYAVCSSATILVLNAVPQHGSEAIKAMLVGSILFVGQGVVLKTLVIYVTVGILHFVFRKQFFLISTDLPAARAAGMKVWFWDFLFYVSFGVVVTSSVQIAGTLLVFSYLIIPAVAAMLFCKRIQTRLLMGWGIGLAGSLLGLYSAVRLDLPTGAAIVCALGAVLIAYGLIRVFLNKRFSRDSEGR